MNAVQHLDVRAERSPQTVGATVVDACAQARVVVVRAHSTLARHREFWDEALEQFVERRPVDENARNGEQTGGLWSDVSFQPDKQHTFRHSSSAQPLHTDGSYIADPPPVVFMVCEEAAPRGGATVFVDGAKLVDTIAREQPHLLRQLETMPVTFSKGGSNVDCRIISRQASVPLRWNYYALSRGSSPESRELARAFREFLSEPERLDATDVCLAPGDAVFFHDSEVLHGRRSFAAQRAGERCLWKGALRL